MNNERKSAIAIGALYIAGTVSGILSVVFLGSVVGGVDVPANAAAHEGSNRLGIFFILCMGFSLAFVPAFCYPLLRRQNRPLATVYLVLRGGVETVLYVLMASIWLLVVEASSLREAASGSLTELLLLAQDITGNVMLVLVFSLNALILYRLLYASRLVPRWISLWGMVAILLHLATGLLNLSGATVGDAAFDATFKTLLNLPVFLQEMVMAVWLIVKGFDPARTVPA